MLDILKETGFGSDLVSTLGLLGFFAVCIITAYVIWSYAKDDKVDTTVPLSHENWDGIREYENEIPNGWFAIFAATIVWGGWYYLAGYPLWSYSNIGAYNAEVDAYNKSFEKKWDGMDNATLVKMGEGVFLNNCSPCHGATGEGMNGLSRNLTMWGNAKGIADTIKNGSKGTNAYLTPEMPAGLVPDAKTASDIAAYVMSDVSTAKVAGNAESIAAGKAAYEASCASCHGADGKGNPAGDKLMAPDLTQYGTPAFVVNILKSGKNGMIGGMPSFENKGTINATQEKAVAAYVIADLSTSKK